jgi:L-threonine kinase
MIRCGTALVPGTCGELVQGTLKGVDFLVTCPVNWFSRVTVAVGPGQGAPGAQVALPSAQGVERDDRGGIPHKAPQSSAGWIVCPADRVKTAQAVRQALDREGAAGLEAVIDVASGLPVGKGMGSSTADISAACFAVAAALGRRMAAETVAEIALSIEPSDATFAPGIMLFAHVDGQICEHLGEAFPLGILALDFGGAVDTVEFHRRRDLAALNAANEPVVGRALELVRTGIRRQDPARLGEGATLSALANQRILPKPRLEALIEYVMTRGAYGVNVAHSGTVAGILLPPGREAEELLVRSLRREFPEIESHYSLRLTGGGPRYLGAAGGRGAGAAETCPGENKGREAGAGGGRVWYNMR